MKIIELLPIPKNDYKENQSLRREQVFHGNKQFLLDIVILNFVLFPCFLYKTYKCQEMHLYFRLNQTFFPLFASLGLEAPRF